MTCNNVAILCAKKTKKILHENISASIFAPDPKRHSAYLHLPIPMNTTFQSSVAASQPMKSTNPMKTKIRSLKIAAAVVAVSSFGLSAQAQTIVKADNTTSLNQVGSWVGGVVPGAANTIQIDATLTALRTSSLGGNLSVLGINQTAATGFQFQISNTVGATLTIGSGGVTKGSSVTGAALIFANAVTLGTSQTWSIASGTNNLQMNGAFSDGGNTLAVTGAGTFDLRGSNTFGSNVTIDTTVSVNAVGAVVTLGGTNTFNTLNIVSGKASGATIGNFGVASNFGDGGTNTVITLGGSASNGIMEYTGNSISINRTVSRDARSAASGIDVTTSGQTLAISGALGSGTQVNAGSNGWAFGGAGNLTLTGVISNATGAGSTGTTITKNGAGTLTLGGASANTYTGTTTVTLGTMIANTDKSLGNTAGVVVNGGTLDIRGTSTGTVTLGSAATLSLTSGSIKFQLGTSFDQLVSSGVGAFTISGGTFALDVTGVGFSYANTYAVLSGFGGSNTVSGLAFTGYDSAGYTASLGTNGVLSFTAVPEPSTWALLGFGVAAVVILRRRVRA